MAPSSWPRPTLGGWVFTRLQCSRTVAAVNPCLPWENGHEAPAWPGTFPSPEGNVPGRSPGAGQVVSAPACRGPCCHQHMTAVSPEPQAEYRRTRTK